MRAHDWSTSPLGEPRTWPYSLRALVRLMLNAKQAMFIAWGPDLAFLYNDDYAPIFGAKHPHALGRPFNEVWSDIWEQIQALVDSTLAGRAVGQEDLLIPMERNGHREDAWFSFSYNPVWEDTDTIAGMFCACTETTDKVRAERRVASERERLRELFHQAPGFMAMLTGPDHTFEMVNTSYYQLVGHRDIVGKPALEALPEVMDQGFKGILDTVYRTGETFVGNGIPIMLKRAPKAKPEKRFVNFVYQPVRDSHGHVFGIFAERSDVTEAKQTEERLRANEAQLWAIFAQAPVGLSEVGADGRFVQVNDELCRILGRSREDVLGRSVSDVTHPDDIPPSLAAVARAVETGEPASFDKRYVRPDGAVMWANSNITRLNVSDERPGSLLVVTIDLTARRHAEAALRESEAWFQAIANSIDQMIWSTRADGCYDFFNQRWYDFTGIPEGSTDGDVLSDLFHPEDQEPMRAVWRHSLATGEPYRGEYRLRHRSGHFRWVLGRAQPVREESVRIARWFGTYTDIQEIVEAREVLTRSREELEHEIAERTAERDRIWQNSNELMGVFGFDGRRRAVNPSWQRVLGAVALEGLVRGERLVDFEDRLRHADGSYRVISWTGVPGDGVFYGIGRDVTEYRRAEDALRQAQKMEAVGQLTGGVAHDLNNLLTIVRSSIEFLRRPNLPEERRIRYIDAIADTVDRASKLTGQLLAFARRQALKPEVFDVSERIRAVIDMLRTIVGSRIRIVIDIACEHCFVEADVTQFETALVNMAVNARDAMDGEGTLRVRVDSVSSMPAIRRHAGGPGRFVAVSIGDTGVGIPNRLGHIFELFFTTKEVGRGTGLGLSQVYGFAKQSGGDVAVESMVGQGTSFTLYLPRTARGIAPDAEGDRRGSRYEEEGRGCRVLLVEDNLEVGRFSTQLLLDLGYETTWAAHAGEALKLLDEDISRFDVVFSDVVMPGMSGIELGREIRRRYPGLPVVLTSGYSHVLAEEGRRGFELLQKPYAVDEVSRMLHRVTRRRPAILLHVLALDLVAAVLAQPRGRPHVGIQICLKRKES
ncbi:PAS domain S-box protein [Microvirga sp. HBU67558]|nr:PAS domain S-box protein [Microvirga sp. HBU67558]